MNKVIIMMLYSRFEDYINYIILFNIYVEYNNNKNNNKNNK